MPIKAKTNLNRRKIMAILIIVLLGLIAARVVAAVLMNSFYIDESARAGLVEAILRPDLKIETEHFNYLFVKTDADISTFGFFIPATVWAFFFSNSIISLRIFMCLTTVAACFLLGKAISYYFNKSRLVWLSATALSLILPWNFLQGMLFWDATFAPVYIIIGFLAFSFLLNTLSKINLKKPSHLIAFIAWPLCLVLTATTYKPAAFLAVGCYIWFLVCLIRRKIYRLRHSIITLLISSIFASPAIISILAWPTTTERSKEISVAALSDFATQIKVIFSNFQKLFSVDFLFNNGDFNRRHSTGAAGMIGLGAVIPMVSTLIFTIRKKLSKNETFLAIFSLFGLFLSFLGSSLTVESPPHSLRANCAWIFFVILIFLGLYKLYQHCRKPAVIASEAKQSSRYVFLAGLLRLMPRNDKGKVAYIILLIAIIILVLTFAYYLRNFFIYYLPMSTEFFSTPKSNIEVLPFVKVYLLK
jgi:hypothetical protein